MIAHIYRHGTDDEHGMTMTIEAPRVTFFSDGYHDVTGPVLVVGTLPDINVIPLADIRWFWVEES